LGICSKFADRLTGFAGVDPRRENSVEIIRWAIDQLGARGLKLHPTTGWRLDDECALEVVGIAVESDVPILVHIGKTIDALTDRHAGPADLIALAREFPDGTFIAGHSGYQRWGEFADREHVPDNLHFDISGWQEIAEGDPDRLKENLLGLMAAFPGRVYFGTDGPFYSFNLAASEKRWLGMVVDCLRECPEQLAHSAPSVTNPPRLSADLRPPVDAVRNSASSCQRREE
jgi:predicted TIM-barrel fold metal-dependent hydrolase